MAWSVDSTLITADSTLDTADGFVANPPTSLKYLALITSEHSTKPNFMSLVNLITGGVGDITACILSMPQAFDLDKAVGAQLDIVGKWVGQARVVTNVLLTGFFGFADDVAALVFGELSNPSVGGLFYELGATFQQTTTLADADYRTILRARIVRNQSNGTLSAIENALQFVFGVPCKVSDIGDLSLAITVSQPITQIQEALLNTLDLLPRPAGVAIGSITYSPH